jgi:hypothetical protein
VVRLYFTGEISPKSEISTSYALAGFLLCTCVFFPFPMESLCHCGCLPCQRSSNPSSGRLPKHNLLSTSSHHQTLFRVGRISASAERMAIGTSHVRFLRNEEPYLHTKGGMTDLTHKVLALLWNQAQLCRILANT